MARIEPDHWTLDKRVNIPIIIAVIAHLSWFVWYVSKNDSQTAANSNDIVELKKTDAEHLLMIRAIERAQNDNKVTLAEIKKDQQYMMQTLADIKTAVSKQ